MSIELTEGPAPRSTHRIPIIDKMMLVLMTLEANPDGASVAALARDLKLSRTTIYRMLNTLAEYGVVARRGDEASYSLGPAIIRLARRVPSAPDLATALRPFVAGLAERLGQTAKATVRDGQEAAVIEVALGPQAFSVSTQVGRRLPLHAGAASKVLLAFAPEPEAAAILNGALVRHTERTLTDRNVLGAELEDIRRQGYAEDRGEYVEGIQAVASPVLDASHQVVAALSITFFSNARSIPAETILAVKQAAQAATRGLGG